MRDELARNQWIAQAAKELARQMRDGENQEHFRKWAREMAVKYYDPEPGEISAEAAVIEELAV